MVSAFRRARPRQVTEIYKCVDAPGGRCTPADKRDTTGKKFDLVSREINVVPGTADPGAEAVGLQLQVRLPEGVGLGSTPTRRSAARILEKELATEQQLLAKAQQDLTEQESVRSGDERNYARRAGAPAAVQRQPRSSIRKT